MMKKIIELTNESSGFKCLICCKRMANLKFKIKRLEQEDVVTSFHVCDQCLAKMQEDIQKQE